MAPAIRYLSADNHTAATPTAKLVNTEPPSLYFRVICKVRFMIVCMWPSMCICFQALQIDIAAVWPCIFTYTLPLLAYSTL